MRSSIKTWLLVATLCGSGLQAQGRFRLADPIAVASSGGGWNVTPAAGALTQSLPVASVQGELPISLEFRLNASHAVQVHHLWKQVPAWAYTEEGIRYRTTEWVDQGTVTYDRPMYGTMHFGYITGGATYGYISEPATYVMEDGRTMLERDFTPFSSISAGSFDLAQKFGFTAKNASAVRVDPSGSLGMYLATPTEMGTWQATLQGKLPVNYGTAISQYKVLLDKDKARVFGFLPTFNAWVPMLWVDRFGHSVTFQWTHTVSGVPAEMTATDTVEAVNQRGKGVKLSWGQYKYTVTNPVDLVRADFIGVASPSIFIKGYPGMAGTRPIAMSTQSVSAGIIRPDIAGPIFRPTMIQIGEPGEILIPSWGSATPTLPMAPPIPGDIDVATWQFTYDANLAALSGATDALGVQASWAYATPTFATPSDSAYLVDREFAGGIWQSLIESTSLLGVTQMDRTDAVSVPVLTERQTWARTIPNGSAQPNWTVIYKSWFPSKDVAKRYTEFTFSPVTSAREYSNGALQTMRVLTSQGTVVASQSQTWTGSTVNQSSSIPSGIKLTRAGEPDRIVATTYVDDRNLQVSRQSVYIGSQVNLPAATTDYEWDSNIAMLDLNRAKTVTNKRFSLATGTQIQPARIVRTEYDPATGLPFRSYLDGGNGLQHGQATAYDSEGRPNYSQVSHNETGFSWPIPYYTSVSYDAASGLPSTKSTSYWDPDSSVRSNIVESIGGFDSAGRPTMFTDTRGIKTTLSYDRRGRMLSKAMDGVPNVTYSYPDERTSNFTVNGRTSTDIRDGFGRLVRRTKPDGTYAEYGYDVHGRLEVLKEFNGLGGSRTTVTRTFDALDRTITQVNATNSNLTYAYSVDSGAYTGANDLAVVTSTIMGLNISSKEYLDGYGQVAKQVAPTGEVIDYTYDGAGQQTKISVTPPAGSPVMTVQDRIFDYDGLGRLIAKTEPETGVQKFSKFNGFGQPGLIEEGVVAAAATRSRSLVFDGLGRLRRHSNGSDSLSYVYNGPDLTSGTSIHGSEIVTQTYEYWADLAKGNRLKKESLQTSGISPASTQVIQYDYDAIGRLNVLTYPGGRVVGYDYDADNRVVGIRNGGSLLVTNVEFDGWGNRSRLAFASGAASEWATKDAGLHLDQWSVKYATTTTLSGPRDYLYDSAERLIKAGEWSISQMDGAGRILVANATQFNLNTSHSFDAYGNVTSHAASGSAVPPSMTNFAFPPMPSNRVPAGSSGWSINSMGETTAMASGTGSLTTLSLGWDGLGRLSAATSSTGGVSQTYRYAPSGLRLQVVDSANSSSNRRYAYSASGLLLSEYSDGGWKRDVVYLGAEAVAEIDNTGIYELHSDHLGTPRIITQGNGTSQAAIAGVQNYGPFGEYLTYHSNGYQPLTGYTGHIQTDQTGLTYMRGRYYSPTWHRFLNSDHGSDPLGNNQFAYVGGRTMMSNDPTGYDEATATVPVYAPMPIVMPNAIQQLFMLFGSEYLFGLGGGGSNGGGGSSGTGTSRPAPQPPKRDQKSCEGLATIYKGNTRFIGREGAWPGVTITRNSAAVIIDQFGFAGDKGGMRPYLSQITGQIWNHDSGGWESLFSGVTDRADDQPSRLRNGWSRQEFEQYKLGQVKAFNGGNTGLYLEIPGIQNQINTAWVKITVPAGVPCPAGTEVKTK
ncbi:MAG TPA: RHS repeat-associated core domain-containing protein [Holophagaceae bacterium]|nr:RHS repeat-associated core domain-containing protein [Holophagaceae bacterium]